MDDPVKYSEKIPVFINITLINTKCDFIGLDIQDDMGRHEVGFKDNTQKFPENDDQGCRMESHFLINKVPGNFHVSTHSSRSQPQNPDMRHVLHRVTFGMEMERGKTVKGSFNPLENLEKISGDAEATHDYILRVVPTVYISSKNEMRYPYQYTYSYRELLQYGHGGRAHPAIWFRYEMSPITVKYTEKRQPFYHFLTTVCAIIGGTFTVAGILDSLIFSAAEIVKKVQLGKLS